MYGVESIGDLSHPACNSETDQDFATLNQVVFRGKNIYHHNLMRINYTTYDVRWAQDVVNPNTEHRDIMMLSDSSIHPFCYARVLGIYHANAIYTGPERKDYQPRCMEFLWVCWFELANQPLRSSITLDVLWFVPMVEDDTFGFVDPADVVQSCHIIPAFASEKHHPDGVAMSGIAQDGNDWRRYYVNR
jgi:hypothetical protein